MRCQLTVAGLVLVANALPAQRAVSAADSALVGRILLAEDRRVANDPAYAQGTKSSDERIRLLAARASMRVADPRFAARDSLPKPAAAPLYEDAAWRTRYRALSPRGISCTVLRGALADSIWAVRLYAADRLTGECASDGAIVSTLTRWASSLPANSIRRRGDVSWHAAGHAIVALARLQPSIARTMLPAFERSPVPAVRAYAARATGVLADTLVLRRLAHDADDNVKEAAIDQLARVAGHAADNAYLDALRSHGYQAIRAAARALKGSPQSAGVFRAALATATRLQRDSSETSRDARLALLERLAEFSAVGSASDAAPLATDFDCVVANAAAKIASVAAYCSPLPITLPPDAVSLALGHSVLLRVTLADSSGGGSFTVRLRGDVAPIMAARVLDLVRRGWYNNRAWYRVEPNFVIQGGGPGSNEYVGHPRFMRDELSSLSQVRGTVGMSTRGHDTGDAQWFVNLIDNPRLTADYTTFGEIVDGIDVVDGTLEGDVIARIEVVPGA